MGQQESRRNASCVVDDCFCEGMSGYRLGVLGEQGRLRAGSCTDSYRGGRCSPRTDRRGPAWKIMINTSLILLLGAYGCWLRMPIFKCHSSNATLVIWRLVTVRS